jgi:hypothetical protein
VSAQQTCDEIRADAAGLMALPAGAPERERAEAHARTCAGCAGALADGRRLLALIEAAPLPAPSPAALQRASAAILADFDGAPRFAAIVVGIVLAAWAVPLALTRAPIALGMDLGVSLMLVALAAVSASLVITKAGRGGGLFVLASALLGLWPSEGMMALEIPVGAHCALIEGLTAVGTGLAAFIAARALGRSAFDKPVLLAGLGGGALAGHAALQIACTANHHLSHAAVFHTGPVALAVGLALLLARTAARRASALAA